MTGYVETIETEKTILTKEAMQEFEKDIEEGKDVTLKDYLKADEKDYKTNISKMGNKVAGGIEFIMNDGLKIVVSTIKKLFT